MKSLGRVDAGLSPISRRSVLLGAGGLALSRSVEAQTPGRTVRIGVVVPATRAFFMGRFPAFRDGLRDLGYVEGKTVEFVFRFAGGDSERLNAFAAELAQLKVDLIFTASAEGVRAARRATQTIPIVFGTVQDPVAEGVVESLARPGGNATGLSALAPELTAKRLGLIKEAVPRVARAALLWAPLSRGSADRLKDARAAAAALGLQLQSLEVRDAARDLEPALSAALKEQVQALTTAPDPPINGERERIVAFAARHRLPAVYAAPEFPEGGGLMSYAPDYGDMWRRAATYADRIFKGARPADLPVEQPSKFLLAINLKTAKQIGVIIPPGLMGRADKIIE